MKISLCEISRCCRVGVVEFRVIVLSALQYFFKLSIINFQLTIIDEFLEIKKKTLVILTKVFGPPFYKKVGGFWIWSEYETA